MQFEDEIILNKQFGRLLILKDLGLRNKHRYVLVKCDCGVQKKVRLSHLKSHLIVSCGCYSREQNLIRCTTHGLNKHPLYSVWASMKQRCYYTSDINYRNYGARGVTVCDEWIDNFKAFYEWAIKNGWSKGLQLDKDKLSPSQLGMIYSPEYCCFLTQKENMQYKKNTVKIEYNGVVKSLVQWAEHFNITPSVVRERLDYGWSPEEALSTPLESALLVTFKNKTQSVVDWCRELGKDYKAVNARVNKLGWSYDRALSTPIRSMKNNRIKHLNSV